MGFWDLSLGDGCLSSLVLTHSTQSLSPCEFAWSAKSWSTKECFDIW